MTKFFYLLFCFPQPLRGSKHSRLQQEDFSNQLLPTDAASEIVGLRLAETPVVHRTGYLPYIHFSSPLLFPQDKIYLETLRHNELNSGFATPMFIMGSLYRFRQCPRDYMARYNYLSSSCPFLDQKMARASSSTITVLF